MAVAIVLIVAVFFGSSSAQLSTKFYSKSCPMLFGTIKSIIKSSVNKEKRMGASLLRLHFHDCFVQLGGPNWKVKLGRRDSKTASLSAANSPGVLPSPSSNLSALISSFKNQGLSTRDLVALSVEKYSENTALFNSHFAKAMIKMGNIRPLTGSSGEIRKNCRKAN
nr:peroxidase 4-like isoform X5 [Ipomoea batatas]GMD27185.1 peroxidase 4-like isoform X5 [Ipomoea batatas]